MTSVKLDRQVMAEVIGQRLEAETTRLSEQWGGSAPINHFVVDDLLPADWAERIRAAFPAPEQMVLKRSLRESKYVAAQMSKYDPLLEEIIYAFQAERVVRATTAITGLRGLEPDELLYAGGISAMSTGQFLNPHIDNSHDKARERYRVLNLLYYVSPGWQRGNGANLELWPNGPGAQPITIDSSFNRLVVMLTDRHSWHSVSANTTSQLRCCVSNYYFSQFPVGSEEYFHVTSFRGRPEQPLRNCVLRADEFARMTLRKLFPAGVRETKHFYDKRR